MSVRTYRRLTRYAALGALSTVALLIITLLGPLLPTQTYLLLLLALPVPVYLAWGPFQADVALNPELDETARRWWRIMLFLLPPIMVLYWHQYVRGSLLD